MKREAYSASLQISRLSWFSFSDLDLYLHTFFILNQRRSVSIIVMDVSYFDPRLAKRRYDARLGLT